MSKYKVLTARQHNRLVKHLMAAEDILESRIEHLNGENECKDMSDKQAIACQDALVECEDLFQAISDIRLKMNSL